MFADCHRFFASLGICCFNSSPFQRRRRRSRPAFAVRRRPSVPSILPGAVDDPLYYAILQDRVSEFEDDVGNARKCRSLGWPATGRRRFFPTAGRARRAGSSSSRSPSCRSFRCGRSMLIASRNGQILLSFATAALAAGLLVRLFMIQHDCGHGALLQARPPTTGSAGRSAS